MMEAVRSSETSVSINQATRWYIPGDSRLHTYCRSHLENSQVLWGMRVHHSSHVSTHFDPVFSQFNPVDVLTTKIHFGIIFPSATTFPEWPVLSMFVPAKIVYMYVCVLFALRAICRSNLMFLDQFPTLPVLVLSTERPSFTLVRHLLVVSQSYNGSSVSALIYLASVQVLSLQTAVGWSH
jgi:hypothetical protein